MKQFIKLSTIIVLLLAFTLPSCIKYPSPKDNPDYCYRQNLDPEESDIAPSQETTPDAAVPTGEQGMFFCGTDMVYHDGCKYNTETYYSIIRIDGKKFVKVCTFVSEGMRKAELTVQYIPYDILIK